MRPKLSEQDTLRRMKKLPGFEMDEDGMGHKLLSPRGLVWIRGVKVTDEVFESELFGSLNISAINERTSGAEGPFQPVPIEVAVKNTAKIDVNPSYAKRIPKDRLKEPILSIFGPDGLQIIDGAHRVYRLNALRKDTVYTKVLRPEVMGYARIKRSLLGSDGQWAPFDTVPDIVVQRNIEDGLKFVRRYEEMIAQGRKQ